MKSKIFYGENLVFSQSHFVVESHKMFRIKEHYRVNMKDYGKYEFGNIFRNIFDHMGKSFCERFERIIWSLIISALLINLLRAKLSFFWWITQVDFDVKFSICEFPAKSLPLHCVVESVPSLQASLQLDSRSPWRRRPNIETDSYVIVPAATPFCDIVTIALQRLGYSSDIASTAKGKLQEIYDIWRAS